MRNTPLIASTVLLLAPFALAQTEADFKAICPKLCAESVKAYKAKNAAWFDANSTTDFSYVSSTGKKDAKVSALAGMKQMFGMSKTIDTKMKCGALKFKNGIGKHVNSSTTTITLVGPDKKVHTMVVTSEVEDSFKKVNGKWKYFQVKELKPPKYTMDGKPFNPGG